MSKKLLLIINPIAGKKRGVDCLPQVVSKFEESGFEVETRYTEIDKNATAIFTSDSSSILIDFSVTCFNLKA